MNILKIVTVISIVANITFSCKDNKQKQAPISATIQSNYYQEPFRPQFHFMPQEKWMNDSPDSVRRAMSKT